MWQAGNSQKPTPAQGPSAYASGERDTPAPSPSGRVILTEFPCGVEAQLPGVEAGLLDSLDWPFPLLCILSTGPPFASQIVYLWWSLCLLLEEPRRRQHMALTQYL